MSSLISQLKLNKLTKLFKNKNTKTILALVLALYASAVAPALPNNIILFFDSIVGKLLFIFLIAYVASRDVQVAIMLAVAFIITLTIINRRRIEQFTIERFVDAPSCDNLMSIDEDDIDETTSCNTGCEKVCDNGYNCIRRKYLYIADNSTDASDVLKKYKNESELELNSLTDQIKALEDKINSNKRNGISNSLSQIQDLSNKRLQQNSLQYKIEILTEISSQNKWNWD